MKHSRLKRPKFTWWKEIQGRRESRRGDSPDVFGGYARDERMGSIPLSKKGTGLGKESERVWKGGKWTGKKESGRYKKASSEQSFQDERKKTPKIKPKKRKKKHKRTKGHKNHQQTNPTKKKKGKKNPKTKTKKQHK